MVMATHRAEPPVPPSPTLSARTTATTLGVASSRLPRTLVNRADLRNSLDAYATLLSASKAYTQALLSLSAASSEIACALETCSRLKGAHEVGSGLLAASGVHHMASNSLTILADAWWKETAIPLLEHHDLYVQACSERSMGHEKAILQKSKELNDAEKRNRKESRSKQGRDLLSFRRGLMELQKRVDELDEEKIRYYSEVLEGEEECWDFIQGKVIKSLRSQLDVYERISSKGLSDATLEPLLSSIPDPFSAYGPPRNDEQIFSILGPNNLTSISPSPAMESTSSSDRPAPSGVINQLIMSPSTPAKGLSRVTSGATSPLLTEEPVAGPSSNGLGISLTAAATLAQQQERPSDNNTGNKAAAVSSVTTTGGVDLFGTDGEDDGGDEASIFSGTEEEGKAAKRVEAATSSDSGAIGTAEKLIREKKKRRDKAAKGGNAKSRLKNTLSIIDESKGANPKSILEARDVNVNVNVDSDADAVIEAEADKTVSAEQDSTRPSWW